MARPRNSELRDRQVNISLTQRELEALRARANRAGKRLAEFSRMVLLAGGAEPRSGGAVSTATERLIHLQLQRLGNNLNQIARHLHTAGNPLPSELPPLLDDIRQVLRRSRSDGS